MRAGPGVPGKHSTTYGSSETVGASAKVEVGSSTTTGVSVVVVVSSAVEEVVFSVVVVVSSVVDEIVSSVVVSSAEQPESARVRAAAVARISFFMRGFSYSWVVPAERQVVSDLVQYLSRNGWRSFI